MWAGVTLLASLITGAAFVPLDPRAPANRCRDTLQAVNARIALVSPEYAERFETIVDRVVPIHDHLLPSLDNKHIEEGEWSMVAPDDICFVLFTSGSTGKPKGILMEHQTMCSMSCAHPARTEVGPGTRVFNFSAFTFDIGVMDYLMTWIKGGCVCIPSDHDRSNDLAGAITRTRANWIILTPTIADILEPKAVPTLKTLISGGEVNTARIADKWKNSLHLYASYGPTEVAICSLNDHLGFSPSPLSLGKPMNSAFWVVDPSCSQRLVPDGCVGELLIQGPLLARGYVSTAGKQALSRWITDPSRLPTGIPSAKAYLTGDLVRKNADDTYDFVGRMDSQVKIRGQRVELGDIETHLGQLLPQSVRGTVQVTRGAENEQQVLTAILWYAEDETPGLLEGQTCAYIPQRPTEDERSMIANLDQELRKLLPIYMIPSVFFILHGTPEKTHSDKVDHRRLLSLAEKSTNEQRRLYTPSAVTDNAPPTTEMEKLLRDMWAMVLPVDKELIGKYDSFFGWGGDSVSAIRLVEEAQEMNIPLSVESIFEDPTLERMAIQVWNRFCLGRPRSGFSGWQQPRTRWF